jgi:WD40 repeat protein
MGVIPAHEAQHIRGVCTTNDGLYIATASGDHTIKLWQADTLKMQATLVGHTDIVYSVVATSMYAILFEKRIYEGRAGSEHPS